MWITNGSVADVAVVWAGTEEGIRGFLVPAGTPGFRASVIERKLSLWGVDHRRALSWTRSGSPTPRGCRLQQGCALPCRA